MSYDDGLFDLKQVEAITNDLRMLCQDLADRLRVSDPSAALNSRTVSSLVESQPTHSLNYSARI